jgi:hypothetical protein
MYRFVEFPPWIALLTAPSAEPGAVNPDCLRIDGRHHCQRDGRVAWRFSIPHSSCPCFSLEGKIEESLDLFVQLLDLQPLSLEALDPGYQSFARTKLNGVVVPSFERLVLFSEENLPVGLKRGTFLSSCLNCGSGHFPVYRDFSPEN